MRWPADATAGNTVMKMGDVVLKITTVMKYERAIISHITHHTTVNTQSHSSRVHVYVRSLVLFQ